MNYDNLTDPKPDELLGRLIAEKLAARQAVAGNAVAEGEAFMAERFGGLPPVRVGKVGYSGRSLREWVSRLKGADAGRGKFGFGVGNHQVKSWSRYALGVVALTFMAYISVSDLTKLFKQSGNIQYRNVVTQAGQRVRIALPDGSGVILAPGSLLRYASDFGTTSRHIELTGTALFTVTKNAGQPFTVRTGAITARVLGTSFTVRHYASDSAVRVVVAEGKVSVGSSVLVSGDAVVAQNSGEVAISRGIDIGRELAWTTGQLRFVELPLSSVIPEIERWYNVKISIRGIPAGAPITATFDTESSSETLQILARLLGAHIGKSGNEIILTRGKL